ncbi:Alcohol dehydrogenase GroES domain protein [Catenulispora acidiphila DSM 44928]|uniref:Alcohol dehydrogenase GroES domain protein n=1 Tax=Catenulispora acidiphila (strain DSM 44928 / JCM 14897 / NBRC 102108 / NRRL B-24433 / ID139908) TaxID=479433 RepID=C7QFY8_CATAD|nr:zinc-binding alcohol dehydrogenase family protein [Catenulispora acidiphila]ACU70965.1 Alcohol dehydrogenase GroES domain protein [Catenulispora acidiphila DSM 44928]
MKAIQFSGPGGPETIAEVDIAAPIPAAGQLAIAVRFAGLNFVDVLARRGAPGYASSWPFVPGMEVGGEVVALGEGVSGFAVGDTVVAFTVDGGGLAETVVAEAGLAARVPDGLALDAATTVPLTWATAVGLTRAAHVAAGDRILVTGAGGGVGDALAAVLALRQPKVLVGGTSTRSAASLAAAYRPAIRDAEFAANAREAADDAAFDVVLESIGGDVSAAMPALLAPGGRLVSYGAAAGQPDPAAPTLAELRRNNWTTAGFSIINRARGDAGAIGDLIAGVFALTAEGLALPAPRVIGWGEAVEAHIAQAENRSPGKTVVAVQD